MKKIERAVRAVRQAEQEMVNGAAAMVPQLRIELLQNRQAVIEGCKGVLEYSESCIRLSGDRLIVKFSGNRLALKTFNSSSAIVEGLINSVEFI